MRIVVEFLHDGWCGYKKGKDSFVIYLVILEQKRNWLTVRIVIACLYVAFYEAMEALEWWTFGNGAYSRTFNSDVVQLIAVCKKQDTDRQTDRQTDICTQRTRLLIASCV